MAPIEKNRGRNRSNAAHDKLNQALGKVDYDQNLSNKAPFEFFICLFKAILIAIYSAAPTLTKRVNELLDYNHIICSSPPRDKSYLQGGD